MTIFDLNDNDCTFFTINIDYFYPVKILTRHTLNIEKKYIYIVAILISFILAIHISNANAGASPKRVLQYGVLFLTNYFVWIFLLDYIYGVIKQVQRRGQKLSERIFEFIISFSLLLVFQLIITNIIYYTYLVAVGNVDFLDIWNDFKPFVFSSILSRFFDLLVIILIIKAIEVYTTIQEQKLEVISLKNELNSSQLNALRSQLNPHFLFNALHNLNTLIGYDDAKAKNMIIKITNLMRKMLDRRDEQFITLAEELEYFKNYLEIEQERFHDRLDIVLDIDNETLSFKVPALLLQPLIENAFKHGISRIGGKGKIHFMAHFEGENLLLKLTNSIPLKETDGVSYSTNHGLENLKSRLSLLFKDQHIFSTERKEEFFEVKVIIIKTQSI